MNTPMTAQGYTPEIWRKAIHLSSLIYPVLYAIWLEKEGILAILIPLLLFGLIVEFLRFRNEETRQFIERFFGFMMRTHELSSEKRAFSGATYVLLAGIIVFGFFDKEIAIYSFSMLIVGDAAAALIGKKFGKNPIGPLQKTWEGSFAFFAASMIVAIFITDLSWPLKIAGALAATLIELLPFSVDDNLTIPVGSSIVMTLLLLAGV